jgi:hypothetical protein
MHVDGRMFTAADRFELGVIEQGAVNSEHGLLCGVGVVREYYRIVRHAGHGELAV